MSYQLDYTGAEVDEKFESCELIKPIETIFNLIYPVGSSIYMNVNSTSPSSLFGGTWAQIQDTFLLAAGSTYAASSVGGEAEHKLTTEEMPGHTHERGTMDITGFLQCYSTYNKNNDDYW